MSANHGLNNYLAEQISPPDGYYSVTLFNGAIIALPQIGCPIGPVLILNNGEWEEVQSPPVVCANCDGQLWVCENHPEVPWDGSTDRCCGGAGMPCSCNTSNPPEDLPGSTMICEFNNTRTYH